MQIGRILTAGSVALVCMAWAVLAAAESESERPTLKLRTLQASPGIGGSGGHGTALTTVPTTKSAAPSMTGTRVVAHACAPCASPTLEEARPLIAALPAGESYELRVLRSAISGFTFRASDANAPASSDERLRLRISRQQVSVAWQMSF
ncbi:MAG: hypothetical protein ABI920_16730 [Casimicrobiaceae bacterium]